MKKSVASILGGLIFGLFYVMLFIVFQFICHFVIFRSWKANECEYLPQNYLIIIGIVIILIGLYVGQHIWKRKNIHKK